MTMSEWPKNTASGSPNTSLFLKISQVVDHIDGPVPKRVIEDKFNALLENGERK